MWTKPQVGEKEKGAFLNNFFVCDCLVVFTNDFVWAAVLLWIYGGGFSTGSSNNPGYIGKYIADKQDVIVVSIK